MNILLSFEFVWISACIALMIRVSRVGKKRRKILDLVGAKAQWIIQHQPNFSWMEPYDYFESVSFHSMVMNFWKPIGSFYDEERLKIPQ